MISSALRSIRLMIATAIPVNAELARIDHVFFQDSELGSRLMT
jgi:hypothetical protein